MALYVAAVYFITGTLPVLWAQTALLNLDLSSNALEGESDAGLWVGLGERTDVDNYSVLSCTRLS